MPAVSSWSSLMSVMASALKVTVTVISCIPVTVAV